MKYLVDTCVISELIKSDNSERVFSWFRNQDFDNLFVSVMSIGELWKGISRMTDSKKKSVLNKWFDEDVIKFYRNRIMAIDFDIVMIWGSLYANLERIGRKIPTIDLLISSTALFYDMILVTRNTKDFVHTGCKLLNPWE